MLNRVVRVGALANYRLEIEFEDGVYGTMNISDRLFGEMFEPLRDEAVFGQVFVDEFGTISWPNGADLAPDAVHQTLVNRRFPLLAKAHGKPAGNPINDTGDCLEQLLEAFADIADRDDIARAAERLAGVQEWIRREAELSGLDLSKSAVAKRA